MRTIWWTVVVSFILCGAAAADLCPKCAPMMFTMDVGACNACGGNTSSGSHPLCKACSKKLNQCEHCRAALNAPAAKDVKPAAPATVDTNASGAYESGKWKYEHTISAKGSRSERRSGMLTWDGKPVAGAAELDRIKTPWGVMQFFGDPAAGGYNSGWLLKQTYDQPIDGKKGRLLPDPEAGAAKVTAERKKTLVDDIENFRVSLRYFGAEDKPFYALTLSVKPIERDRTTPFMLDAVVDRDTALKVIDWLARSEILGRAYDYIALPGRQCYVISIKSKGVSLDADLGWEKPMLTELLALRALLKGDAAKQMDVLMGRLNGYIKEWTGKPYEPPAAPATNADGAKLEQTPDGNFVLYVSNQSMALKVVDIKVTIDGRAAVDESFDVEGTRGVPQHNWKKFVFALARGPHELKAESVKGGATVTQRFEIKDKHWAVIDYWYDPRAVGGAEPTKKRLIFRVQDTPIYFM